MFLFVKFGVDYNMYVRYVLYTASFPGQKNWKGPIDGSLWLRLCQSASLV